MDGEGSARLEDVVVGVRPVQRALIDDDENDDDDEDKDEASSENDAQASLKDLALAPEGSLQKTDETMCLVTAPGALRVEIFVRPSRCFRDDENEERLHFRETSVVVPVRRGRAESISSVR